MPDIIHAATIARSPRPGAVRRFQCRHIFTDGRRCGSPALRSEDFCFYHHTSRGRAAVPAVDCSQGEHRATPFVLQVPELAERSGVQLAIAEVLNRLASNELDPRRAGLLLYGLQIASANLAGTTPPTAATEPLDDITFDPALGPVAPPAEYVDPAERRESSGLFAQLLQALHSPQPAGPAEQPSPAAPDPTA